MNIPSKTDTSRLCDKLHFISSTGCKKFSIAKVDGCQKLVSDIVSTCRPTYLTYSTFDTSCTSQHSPNGFPARATQHQIMLLYCALVLHRVDCTESVQCAVNNSVRCSTSGLVSRNGAVRHCAVKLTTVQHMYSQFAQ